MRQMVLINPSLPKSKQTDAFREAVNAVCFNEMHPMGTPVRYRLGNGKLVAKTIAPASLFGGIIAAVPVEGFPHAVPLAHLEVVSANEQTTDSSDRAC